MDALIWAFGLLGIALLCFALEIFLPTGGVLAFLSACALAASVAVGFTDGYRSGMIVLVVSLVLVPISAGVAIKVWPNTPLGRRMVAQPPSGEHEVLPMEQLDARQALIGRIGIATTKMLPSGEVKIDGDSYDAVSSGVPIDDGQIVEVVDVKANRIVVAPSHASHDQASAEESNLNNSFEDLDFG